MLAGLPGPQFFLRTHYDAATGQNSAVSCH